MHQDLYLLVQLKLTYITREPKSLFYICYLNSKAALDESSAYIQNIKHNTRKKKIPLKTHNVIKVLKIKGIYVNIRLEYIPVPQTSTPPWQKYFVLTRNTCRQTVFGVELIIIMRNSWTLDFLCRRWCEQDYQHHFLKKTFLHGEVDMLSFNILTIFALLLYVSCGLAMASKKEVSIFFILYISCKTHFSKGTTLQTHCWTGIYWEVNV